jgi:hypothetical protein
MAAYQATKTFLASLSPTTEPQKQAVASANALAGQIEHARILMSLQLASPAIGAGAVSIIVIWAVVLFFLSSVYSPSPAIWSLPA